MKTLPLTNGQETIVDDDVFEWAQHFKWRATPKSHVYYAHRGLICYLHRMVMEPCEPFYVDHINRDPLDNRKANLRLCTAGENLANRKKVAGTKTKYKGVQQLPSGNWKAQKRVGEKLHYLGSFPTEEEAARAYDNAGRKIYGDFHLSNLPL